MSHSFLFVPVAANISAQQMYSDAPMLFLAMITAASWTNHQQQMSLDAIYRQELANRTIIRPRKSLSLVQSVLVYLSWYHFVFSHKTQQTFFLHHLVIALALDIGLHRQSRPMFFTNQQKPQEVEPQEKRARQRAFLGCYYLASMVSAALQKPNLLKHNPDMVEWAQELKRDQEFDTDAILGHLISLRQLDDQVQESLFTGAAADAPLTDAGLLMRVRFLETQLKAWKHESAGAEYQRSKFVVCIPSNAHAAAGWDVKAAQDMWAMRFVTDLTRGWYVRKINPRMQMNFSPRPAPYNNANDSPCPGHGALPTPPDGRTQNHPTELGHMDFSNTDTNLEASADEESDPFALMKSAEFDMEQLFDMGIWGDEAYSSMGFGGGGLPF
ncbi:hypothetical protein EJ07DRAFT_153879 [Lizonia empirigonia]|nr:hypothetical protein EJ07DRAFT_153879 [Lizonia empirigonia]